VPEIEMPGHSGGVFKLHPELACFPERPGGEYCLGNPEARKFLKALITEFAGLFPESRIIHLGGDEADTGNWEKCPCCQRAIKEKKLSNERALERDFAVDMSRHVLSLGRTPMVWFTDNALPEDVMVQVWRSLLETLEASKRRAKMVFSVHNTCYFDYPAHAGEPKFDWMPALPEEVIYSADPCGAWKTEIQDYLLGMEACLWTEYVPFWRTFPKIMPRLTAFAEAAWSPRERMEFNDLQRRKQLLSAGGYIY